MKRKEWTKQDKQMIVEDYESGLSVTAVKRLHGGSIASIITVLHRAGVRVQTRDTSRKADPTPEEIEARKALIRDSWSEHEEKARRGCTQEPYELPVCKVAHGR